MPAAIALRDISEKTREQASASDCAGKDKSFPILKAADVKAALESIGRAGSDNYDAATLKRNILRIAKRKGFPIPTSDQTTEAARIQLPAHAIALAADDTGDGPATTWLQVLRVGKFWSPRYKDFSVTKQTLRKMVENFATITPKKPTELPLDFNHGTNRPDTIEQGKAAGWIKSIELREGDTELWAQVELTAEAADLVRNQEYRYVSATFEFDHVHTDGEHRQKRIGPTLLAAALTNTPFVEGMQPVTLDKSAAVALADDDEAAEDLFSYDEQRRRVQAALSDRYGGEMGCSPCAWLCDLFDGHAIYSEGDGCRYRIDFSLGADGAITFTSDPVEVRVAYEPLSSAEADSGVTDMATIKVKAADGKEIEIAEETAKALAKQFAPKGDEDTAAADELRTQLTKSEADNLELAKRVDKLELDKKEMAARGLVDALIRAGKVPVKKRDQYVTLAIKDRKTFDELTADLPQLYSYDEARGSTEDGGDLSASAQLLALAKQAQDADPKLSVNDAFERVCRKNKALYAQYRTESAIRV